MVMPIPNSVTVKISNDDHVWHGEKPYIMIDRLMRDTDIAEALIFRTRPESQDMKRHILHTDREKPGPLLRIGPINGIRIVGKADDSHPLVCIRSHPMLKGGIYISNIFC